MTFKVVHVRQRGGASAKRVVDLTKTAPKTLARMSPEKPKPRPKTSLPPHGL
jgi:hypothetical protein